MCTLLGEVPVAAVVGCFIYFVPLISRGGSGRGTLEGIPTVNCAGARALILLENDAGFAVWRTSCLAIHILFQRYWNSDDPVWKQDVALKTDENTFTSIRESRRTVSRPNLAHVLVFVSEVDRSLGLIRPSAAVSRPNLAHVFVFVSEVDRSLGLIRPSAAGTRGLQIQLMNPVGMSFEGETAGLTAGDASPVPVPWTLESLWNATSNATRQPKRLNPATSNTGTGFPYDSKPDLPHYR
ncbi:hypothetical protein B0H16DRAFT_1455146 [Mycena metata]|uniref:Uncharacterized protein n=1 Tax=Mycena metata TaxID=1033252 RepID=A0AAD7JH63_9AGAR|nr:hypothetical protein B0H16DRAFT_1455146 [Mycena metata]